MSTTSSTKDTKFLLAKIYYRPHEFIRLMKIDDETPFKVFKQDLIEWYCAASREEESTPLDLSLQYMDFEREWVTVLGEREWKDAVQTMMSKGQDNCMRIKASLSEKKIPYPTHFYTPVPHEQPHFIPHFYGGYPHGQQLPYQFDASSSRSDDKKRQSRDDERKRELEKEYLQKQILQALQQQQGGEGDDINPRGLGGLLSMLKQQHLSQQQQQQTRGNQLQQQQEDPDNENEKVIFLDPDQFRNMMKQE